MFFITSPYEGIAFWGHNWFKPHYVAKGDFKNILYASIVVEKYPSFK